MKFRDPKTGEVFETICAVYERFCGKNERCSKECSLAFAKSCSAFVWEHQREAARLMGYEVIESEDESEDGVEICQKVKEVNMEKKDKPLSEWTLGETKSYCKSRGHKSGCCEGCLITDENGYCSIQNAPEKWDIEEESGSTVAKDINVPGKPETMTAPVVTDKNVGHKPAKPRLAEVLGVEEDEEWTFPGVKEKFRVHDGYLESKCDGKWPWSNIVFAKVCDIINHPESIIRVPRLTEAELERCRVYNAKYITRDTNAYLGTPRVYLWKDMPERDANGDYNSDDFIAGVDANYFPSAKPGDCICVEEAGRDA